MMNKKLATNSAEIETEDLLLEIFLRLPIHSIQRFITACQQWKSILRDPTFRKQWRFRNLKPSTGLFLHRKNPLFVPFSSCSNRPTVPELKIIYQSCNGLLLCSSRKRYEVYNPTTDESFALPKLGKDVRKPGTRILTMILAFDPKLFGLGYKVVCFVSKNDHRVLIYSSNTRIWKPVTEIPFNDVYENGVYWNGAIHWIHGLSYFDIENERFKRMPSPPRVGDYRKHNYFGESYDRLNYAKFWQNSVPNMYLYELKRDYSEWVLKYRITLEGMSSYMLSHSVLSVVHGENESFLILNTSEGILRYNIVSKTSEVLPFAKTGAIYSAFQYIESQCSV